MNSVASFWRTCVRQLPRIIGHRYFFWAIVIFFAINALLLAVSITYPMIFDEEYHVGIIDIYARQWSPFIDFQPPEAALYGDITRYSSYLYHYLASFPYRIVKLFTNDLQTAVVTLRLCNVAIALAALYMYRKVLIALKVPPVLVHAGLLFFVALPLVPFSVAHVSYDTLTLLLVPSMFYALLKAASAERWVVWLVALAIIGLTASLVKFTMLPIFAASAAVAAVVLLRRHKWAIFSTFSGQLKRMQIWQVAGLAMLLLLSAGLFIERYGGNIVRYGSVMPDCAQVQSEVICSAYSPWARNAQLLAQQKIEQKPINTPFHYTFFDWLPHIIDDFFITAAYPATGTLQVHQGTPQNLVGDKGNPLLRFAGWTLFIGGILAVIWARRTIYAYRWLVLCVSVCFAYVLLLWMRNYSEYAEFAVPIAMQGRYFIPLLPFIIAAMALAYRVVLKRSALRVAVFIVACLFFAFGAGAITFLTYSDASWYWPVGDAVAKLP